MADAPTLSVVVPAYNEQDVIRDAVHEIQEQILDRVSGSELIVVDDGSRDETGAILDELAAEDERLRVVHRANGGHGAALRTGLEVALGEFVLLLDADRQIDVAAFALLWDAGRGRDGAFGVRSERDDPAHRLLLSASIRAAIRLLFGVSLRDANIPFKLFRRERWLEARGLIPETTLAPSLFFALYAARRDLDVTHLEVPHRRRAAGEQTLRPLPLLRFCTRAFGQLVAFRSRLGR